MIGASGEGRANEHEFIVVAVEPAEREGFVAVTLVDARGGRVTLNLDAINAGLLRDMLADQLA